MEEIKEISQMLELMNAPCFCVRDRHIVKTNQDAARLFLREGMELDPLLSTGVQEYAGFSGGCLYLNLNLGGADIGCSVVRVRNYDIFILEPENESRELQALALAAQHLRKPLTGLVTAQEQLRSGLSGDSAVQDQLNQLSRSLAQLQRIVGNMSDAYGGLSHQEYRDVPALVREIGEKAQTLSVYTEAALTCDVTAEQISCLVDAQELERAIWNLLSNALKFTPRGSSVTLRLFRRGKTLYLQIQDSGSGIAEAAIGNVFRRFQRQPSLEDSRMGLGLGMALVRSAAMHHGGTVLIDQPEGQGTRVTMTLPIPTGSHTVLRSPVLHVDYSGGMDHALLELSDVLAPEAFAEI